MSDWVTLSCPSCGGSLQFHGEVSQVVCEYCGNQHFVAKNERGYILDEIKYWKCPKCSKFSVEGQDYCQYCGEVLSKVCPGCNYNLYVNADFCPRCGRNYDKTRNRITQVKEEKDRRLSAIDAEILQINGTLTKLAAEKPKGESIVPILGLLAAGFFFFVALLSSSTQIGNLGVCLALLLFPRMPLAVVLYKQRKSMDIKRPKMERIDKEANVLKSRLGELIQEREIVSRKKWDD